MRKLKLLFLSILSTYFLLSCTAPPEKVIPPEEAMYFPLAMALKNQTLLVSSNEKQAGFGRMVAIDTNAVHTELNSSAPKEPIAWQRVVSSNVLIPADPGPLYFKDTILFASRADNSLYALPTLCNAPRELVSSCPQSASIKLFADDPYALDFLAQEASRDIIIATYLSSDRIDILELDKKTSHFKLLKYFLLQNVLSQEQKIVTKNIHVAKNQVFFLLEQKLSKDYIYRKKEHESPFRLVDAQENTGALLLAIKIEDLLTLQEIKAEVKIWNLQKLFGISSAQDFYIDSQEQTAIILAHSPELLYKIGLTQNTLIERQIVCRGAGSLAISENLDRLFVPCFNDNRIISYSLSSLGVKAASQVHGRGPAFVSIDEKHKKIYVSYNSEHIVGIFDFSLKYLGHLFQATGS